MIGNERRSRQVAAVELEDRACAVCSRQLRSDNATGVCSRCSRAHLAAATCLCGCGRHLDARYPGRRFTLDPDCIRRVGALAVLGLRFSPAGRVTNAADLPDGQG